MIKKKVQKVKRVLNFFFLKKKKKKKTTWHIGPPCVLRVIVSRRRANSRLCSCAGTCETTLFPVQRIDKEGRDAPDFRVLESCGTPRGDSTYPPLSDNSVAAGDGGGSENTLAWNLASERRVLGYCVHCLNVSCRPENLSVIKKGTKKNTHQDLNSVDRKSSTEYG